MSTLNFRSQQYYNLITFGRPKLRLFAIVAAETLFLGATFFAAEPPFVPLPVQPTTAYFISGLLALILGVVLYAFLSGLGYHTYSPKLHNPTQIFKCWILYLAFSAIVVYLGYLLLVYPYSMTPVPKLIDIGLGVVFTTVYALLISAVIYAESIFSENRNSKAENIDEFLLAADRLREQPESEVVDQPRILLRSGESILAGLQTSELEDTKDLAIHLQDWLEKFKKRELQGQKKMVGDLPDRSIRFGVWDERYKAFQHVRKELEKMDSSAIDKVILSIRGE